MIKGLEPVDEILKQSNKLVNISVRTKSKKYHNCVFVGRSLEGVVRFSCLLNISSRFGINVEGNDKRYNFHVIAINPYIVFLVVAESAIDHFLLPCC